MLNACNEYDSDPTFELLYCCIYVGVILEARDEDYRKEQLVLDPFFLGRI